MKERPILFSAPMVRAILDGRKTQTRRIAIKTSQPRNVYISDFDRNEFKIEIENKHSGQRYWKQCPFGTPGDRLWVRETFCTIDGEHAFYRANYQADPKGEKEHGVTWTPSIHMPRWASRILLEITGVRVERLQDISFEDAIAEGVYNYAAELATNPKVTEADIEKMIERHGSGKPQCLYAQLWESINGAGSWKANPWVWVVEFKRVTP
jgi:hypothetical protein